MLLVFVFVEPNMNHTKTLVHNGSPGGLFQNQPDRDVRHIRGGLDRVIWVTARGVQVASRWKKNINFRFEHSFWGNRMSASLLQFVSHMRRVYEVFKSPERGLNTCQ